MRNFAKIYLIYAVVGATYWTNGQHNFIVEHKPTQCVLQVSQPKSGTHLLQKALYLLSGQTQMPLGNLGLWQSELFQQTPEQFEKMTRNALHVSVHLLYDKQFDEIILRGNCQVFFSVRHPLDLLVSWAYYIKEDRHFPRAKGLSISEIIDDLLNESYLSYHVAPYSATYVPPTKGLRQAYEGYLPWRKAPNVLTIKFEDLVGPKGGGSLEAQKAAVRNIAKHLGILLSQKDIDLVCDSLFGGTYSFRRGQIGAYKKELSPEQLARGIELMQDIIDDLGYDF